MKVMEKAHREVFRKEVEYASPRRYGITSDGSRIAQYGVPTLTYAPDLVPIWLTRMRSSLRLNGMFRRG